MRKCTLTPKPKQRCCDEPLAVLVLVSPAVTYASIDGPAVRIRADARADTWYPFARLRQIECYGPVACSANWTPTLLSQQIPVHWYDGAGIWLGVSLPWQLPEQALPSKLASLQRLDDWTTRLNYFLAAERRRAMLSFVRSSGLRVPTLDGPIVLAYLQKQLHYHLSSAQAVLEAVSEILSASTTQAWYGEGLPIHELAKTPRLGGLAAALAQPLQWHAWSKVWEDRKKLEQIWRSQAQRLAYLSQLRADLEHQSRLAINRFESWLDDELLERRI